MNIIFIIIQYDILRMISMFYFMEKQKGWGHLVLRKADNCKKKSYEKRKLPYAEKNNRKGKSLQ